MNRLDEILAVKRSEIELLRPKQDSLRRQAIQRNDSRRFGAALRRADEKLGLIAEVKKASPSAGVIARAFDPVAIAENYAARGADAISVLTDREFFQGSLDDLAAVRRAVSLPVLRKDFILDELQVMESAAAGADAILLIVAALEQETLVHLLNETAKYQMDALVEVHTLAEMERAIDAGAAIIGINNRNLSTFAVDLTVTDQLGQRAPNDVVLVSESGIKTAADAARVRECGVDAILVGEALMRGTVSIADLR